MSPPRRLTFVVGTTLLSASFATFVAGCDKNQSVNVHPDADVGDDPAAEEGGEQPVEEPEQPADPVEPAGDTAEPTEAPPDGPNVNVVAPD